MPACLLLLYMFHAYEFLVSYGNGSDRQLTLKTPWDDSLRDDDRYRGLIDLACDEAPGFALDISMYLTISSL